MHSALKSPIHMKFSRRIVIIKVVESMSSRTYVGWVLVGTDDPIKK